MPWMLMRLLDEMMFEGVVEPSCCRREDVAFGDVDTEVFGLGGTLISFETHFV